MKEQDLSRAQETKMCNPGEKAGILKHWRRKMQWRMAIDEVLQWKQKSDVAQKNKKQDKVEEADLCVARKDGKRFFHFSHMSDGASTNALAVGHSNALKFNNVWIKDETFL